MVNCNERKEQTWLPQVKEVFFSSCTSFKPFASGMMFIGMCFCNGVSLKNHSVGTRNYRICQEELGGFSEISIEIMKTRNDFQGIGNHCI